METEPTHAVLSTFDVDPSKIDEPDFGLRNVIVPGGRTAPGFVSEIWTRSEDGRTSVALVSFAAEDDARAFQARVRANADNQAAFGLTLRDISVVEVKATASA